MYKYRQDEYATGFVRPLTTLLFFDKVYVPRIIINSQFGEKMGYKNIPSEYLCPDFFFDESIDISHNSFYYKFLSEVEKELIAKYPSNAKDIMVELTKIYNGTFIHNSIGRNRIIKRMTYAIQMQHDFRLTPIYFDRTDLEKSLTELATHYDLEDLLLKYGEEPLIPKKCYKNEPIIESAYEVAIKNIPMALEEELEQKQIIQIKSDKKSSEKLKNFRLFLNNIPAHSTPEQITELLEKNINEYKSALRKHGVKTAIGTLSTIFAFLSAIFGIISGNGIDGLSIASTGCSLAAATIEYSSAFEGILDTRRSPIAYYYDITRLAK